MPLTSNENPSTWVTLTFKVPSNIHDLIVEYEEEHNHESMSHALRMLVSVGLQSDYALNHTIRANAEALAFHQLSDALDEAITKFREARSDYVP